MSFILITVQGGRAQEFPPIGDTSVVGRPPVNNVDESVRFGVSLQDLFRRSEPGLAEVLWHSETPGETSMGFCVDPIGIYVCVRPPEGTYDQIIVRRDGEDSSAELVLVDEVTGLCLLRLIGEQSGGLPYLPLAGGENLEAGTVVFGMNRLGTGSNACIPGRIAGRDTVYYGEELPTSMWRVNIHLSGNVAGGPVLSQTGAVVAVVSDRRLRKPSEYHAIPIDVVEKLLRDNESLGRTGAAWIGATFHLKSTTPQIISLRDGSPAAAAGLQPGDVVLRVGDRKVSDLDDLVDACYYLSPGTPTEVDVLRGLEKLTFNFIPTLGTVEMPAPGNGDTTEPGGSQPEAGMERGGPRFFGRPGGR